MANHIYTYDDPPSERDLRRACEVLEKNGVICYPTDFNWAFGCDAANPKALDRIRRLKPQKELPFSILCASISMASLIGSIDNKMYRCFKKALPGPFTILIQPTKLCIRMLKDRRKTVGIRIPDSKLMLALVEVFGKPLATTSVPNLRNGEPPKMGYQVVEEFGHGIDLVLDLGEEVSGLDSTIIDCTTEPYTLIRTGVGDPSFFDL